MDNEQINKKIAEVKGWFDIYKEPNGDLVGKVIMPDGHKIVDDLPKWAENISHAWWLVDEMVSSPGVVNVQTESNSDVPHSTCYFRKYPLINDDLIFEHGKTPSLAICLAYLKWKGIEI